jgi:hypothetical protein
MSFLNYVAEKIGKPPPGMALWEVESKVSRCFYEWLKESGGEPWDEYAAAAEIERIAKRIAGREPFCGE